MMWVERKLRNIFSLGTLTGLSWKQECSNLHLYLMWVLRCCVIDREFKQWHFWVMHINQKWALFSFIVPWRYQICMVKCLKPHLHGRKFLARLGWKKYAYQKNWFGTDRFSRVNDFAPSLPEQNFTPARTISRGSPSTDWWAFVPLVSTNVGEHVPMSFFVSSI